MTDQAFLRLRSPLILSYRIFRRLKFIFISQYVDQFGPDFFAHSRLDPWSLETTWFNNN